MSAATDLRGPAASAASANRYAALAGNPNCGKTTLFNALTGLRQRVGNYPGVTVERREGNAGSGLQLVDLPGTYSLNARSPDEEITRDVLIGAYPPVPDLVVVVVDASNLTRNLYLALQILDLGRPVVLCLNMMDVAQSLGAEIDAAALQKELGVPVIPTVASRGRGLQELRSAIAEAAGAPAPRWRMPDALKPEVEAVATRLAEDGLVPAGTERFVALLLLTTPGEQPAGHLAEAAKHPAVAALLDASRRRLAEAGLDAATAVIEARYRYIGDLIERTVHQGPPPVTPGDRFDRIATHRIWGFVLFFLVMGLMFQAIFSWAAMPMGLIELALDRLGSLASSVLPEGDFRSLVVDGVIAGVGGVIIFIPQIVLLFLFIGLLEDSGYMARAAFVMDRLMSKVGLHGKSFIPLLSSFACAIPGIMAARTIESPRDRMVTILVAPLMSCSARLPVYTLLIAGFIPPVLLGGFLSLPALVMVSLYLLGLVAALLMAALLKRTLFKGEPPLFLMELPPYRLPSARTVLLQVWERSAHFVRRAGTIILAINILLWAAMSYPGSSRQSAPERLRGSIAGRLGHVIEPVVRPFGMDWKVGIGILGSFAAREVFVSTMAIVYNVEEEDEERQSISLREQMRQERIPETGAPRFTAISAAALMVFYVLAMQCVSTLAVVRRETGSWKWPLFQWAYMFVLAWGGATLVYQIGTLLMRTP